jgi:mannose-6-phosphate isomerase
MSIPPFKTEPFFHSRPWGGRAMAAKLGKTLPPGPVAESWEVSTHPNGLCRISGGAMHGMSLADLVREAGRDLLGQEVFQKYEGEFPLLVKLIDVNGLASVQVHPNDTQARELEGYPRGKTEAWYIIDRSESARFSLGLMPGTTAERFRAAIGHGRTEELLASPVVRPGDCLFVPPGTVHAAGNGVLLLEIQQSCDITYRVYDWDRADEQGRRRELHVEKALQVIDFGARPRVLRASPGTDVLSPVLACDFFEIQEARLASGMDLPARSACSTGTIVSGACVLESEGARIELACGDSFVVPAGTPARLAGGTAAIVLTTLV